MKFSDLRNLAVGEELVVTTANGKFYGNFGQISSDGSRLELRNVTNQEGKCIGRSKYIFEANDVKVEVLTESESSYELESSTEDQTEATLTRLQVKRVFETIDGFVYIQQADSTYFKAIEEISKNLVIGVSCEGITGLSISILTISTPEKIFIFDLPALNHSKTFNDLETILSSASHLKVIHNCQTLKFLSNSSFNFNINPVFDLMLVSAQFYPKEVAVDLVSCIREFLGFEIESFGIGTSFKRPISRETLKTIATSIAYHLIMYHKLAQKMFAPFNQLSAGSDVESFFDGLNIQNTLSLSELEQLSGASPLGEIDASVYSMVNHSSEM